VAGGDGEEGRGDGGRAAERLEAVLESIADLNSMLTDPDALYHSLLERLSRILSFYSGSIQLLEGSSCRIVAFHGGLDPEIVPGLRFPLDPAFPNYAVIQGRAPLALPDVSLPYPHFRNQKADFSSGHIRSWLGVPMIANGAVIGMMTLDRIVVEPFLPDEIRIVQAFADNAAVAIRNSMAYRCLDEAMEEKDRLIREVHHRVKNSLQLVSSLLSLKVATIEGERNRDSLRDLIPRIDSISTAHELLFRQAEPGMSLDLGSYIRELVDEFSTAFLRPGVGFSIGVELAPVTVGASMAISLGLALDELLINAAKYAFPDGRKGRISVTLRREEDGASLGVEDDGIGMRPGDKPQGSGFGLESVRAFVRKCGGEIELETAPGRTAWMIRFKPV
jgi:two-component sensor histidine kinase